MTTHKGPNSYHTDTTNNSKKRKKKHTKWPFFLHFSIKEMVFYSLTSFGLSVCVENLARVPDCWEPFTFQQPKGQLIS